MGFSQSLLFWGLTSLQLNPFIPTIHGEDDRKDVWEVKDVAVADRANSTVAFFLRSNLDFSKEKVVLSVMPFETAADDKTGVYLNLCKDEKFYGQPEGAFCSGTLIAPDQVLTAGHCVVDEAACMTVGLVFGFAIRKDGDFPDSVPTDEVYGCAGIVKREENDSGRDYAVIRLDRPVKNHVPLAVDPSTTDPKDGTPLVVIGYPYGLPAKIDSGAHVLDASKDGYFLADTDTFSGSSGSAVFNANTGLIEGVMARGDLDFVRDSAAGCARAYRCGGANKCDGEDVTKVNGLLAVHQ